MGAVIGWDRQLAGVQLVALDSMAFIYHFEAHPGYCPLTRILFSRIEEGALRGCTSVLTLCEVLTGARKAGYEALAALYQRALSLMPNLTVHPIDQATAVLAADLRAEVGLRTPDALQVACAINSGAGAFITNDARLRRVPSLQVLVLADYA